MFRFSLDEVEWILRFAKNIELDENKQQKIVCAIIELKEKLFIYHHGSSFAIFNDDLGLIILNIERIPSSIITVSNVITKQNWYGLNS
jgi:hypothetical protein